jgi:isoquinoline 1-oxidoreductase subunit beta
MVAYRRVRIHRVTVTIDCGLPVNRFPLKAQCRGAIGFGLTQIVELGAILLKQGQVEQSNFDGFRPPTRRRNAALKRRLMVVR